MTSTETRSTATRSTDPLAPPTTIELDLAEMYERRTSLYDGWREQLIERLAPRRGDTVLDISCGSGLNLPALHERVGPHGRIIGIEESPELLAVARHRVRRRGWHNVELLAAPPTSAELISGAHAALLCAADDVLQSPTRLAYLMTRLRPGARVAAGGWKLPPEWMWPLRAYVKAFYGPLVGAAARLDEPWRLLADHLPNLTVARLGFGTGYLAHGTIRH
jgi:demethylmenaquinone methyltransferase/2-methoxy-6-polyprenyl-1,4-benzoquinol methylase